MPEPPDGPTPVAAGGVGASDWLRLQRQALLGIETHGEDLTLREVEFVESFLAAGHRLEWIPRDTVTCKPTNDFIWLDNDRLLVELKTAAGNLEEIELR